MKRIVYAGSHDSFAHARQHLFHLTDLCVDSKAIERVCHRIGQERIAERDAACQAWQNKTLVERDQVPPGAVVPKVAVVEADGGRFQVRSDAPSHLPTDESLWKEDKVGVLLSMHSQVYESDPCPQIPACFVDAQRATELAIEVGHAARPKGEIPGSTAAPQGTEEASEADKSGTKKEKSSDRPGVPEPLVKTVLATRQSVDSFGPLLASAAYERHFMGAERKAFVGDGSAGNWGIQAKWFASYVPIVDLIHALSYVYSAAMAGRSFEVGWPIYCLWIQWVWSGEVGRVIAAIEQRQEDLGKPEEGEKETTARSVLHKSLVYLRNQSDKMDYARYRREGLPITSSAVESTIKQINQRVKGTEKFWSDPGSEAMLQLRADYLSETEVMEKFWQRREQRLDGFRTHRKSA